MLLGNFWFQAPFDFDHQLRVSVCVCVCLLLETPIIKDNVDPNNKNGLRGYPLLLGSFWFEAPP